jgi:hypothetical protein
MAKARFRSSGAIPMPLAEHVRHVIIGMGNSSLWIDQENTYIGGVEDPPQQFRAAPNINPSTARAFRQCLRI